MSFATKKQIKKELLQTDWAGKVEEAAVAALAVLLEEQHGGQLDALHDILRACTSDLSPDGKITAASVHAAATSSNGNQQVELFEFIDAFSVPRLVFDPVQRKLLIDSKPRVIHATAESKHQLYLQRLLLIQQRLQRSRMFAASNLLLPNSGGRGQSVQLTDLQSLKGLFGATRFVLGCISRGEDGRYALEDATGSLPLDLSAAETAAGFYTENCVVIAEGSLGHDGAFHVRALGLPPAEPRHALPAAAARLPTWGGAPAPLEPDSDAARLLAAEEAVRGGADRVVVLANVWLDRPEVLESLHTLLNGFSGVPTVPAIFVLMGNFHSRAGAGGGGGRGGGGRGGGDSMLAGGDVDYGLMRELFGQLAGIIDQYPRLKAESRFVFMPGPDDPGPGPILPQPPLPRSLTTELRRVLPGAHFASNPCRLRYATQRIVLFRHDLQRRMRRRALLPLAGAPDGVAPDPTQPSATPSASSGGPSSAALWGHTALTLLQQGHLAPLPLLAQPVYWAHDGALGLYPLPDAVILADASAGQEEFVHEGCRVMNPGCLPGGFFAAYLPCVQQAEMSELPRPGEDAPEAEAPGPEGAAYDGQQENGEGQGADGMDAEVAGEGGDGEAVRRRAPLAQRQAQQQQRPAAAAQKAGGGKPQKPRKPRAPKQGGKDKQAQLPAAVQRPAAAVGDGGADSDVEMVEPDGPVAAAPAAAAAAAGKDKDKGKAAKGKAAGPRQGTLAMVWAKQPRPAAAPEDGLEDDDVGDAGAAAARRCRGGGADEEAEDAEDVEMVEAEEEEDGAARRQRRQQANRKRRVVEEEEEEEEEDALEDGGEEAGGEAGRKTWLDDEEEDYLEDED